MNRKILTIILAVVLIAGFFLPLTKLGSGSAFDAVQGPSPGSDIVLNIMKYGWLLIPVSALALLIGAINKGQYVPARFFWALLPLLYILFWIVWPVTKGEKIDAMFSFIGVGFYVMLAASLVLAVYPGKR